MTARFVRSVPLLALVAAAALADVDVEVRSGDKITGTISPATDVEVFRFRVPKGAVLSVKAAAAKKGPQVHVRLKDPAGDDVADAEGKSASITKQTASVSGLYSVEVTSKDGVATGDYTLAVTWKSPTSFGGTVTVPAAGTQDVAFAADAGATATFTVKPAKKSLAAPTLASWTKPDASVETLSGATQKRTVVSTGDCALTVASVAGGSVVAGVKVKPPAASKRKYALTSATIGTDDAAGASATSAIVGPAGGFVSAPIVAPGQPGAQIDGSAVSIPAGALPIGTAIVIATAPALDVPGVLRGAGPTVFFGPEGTDFAAAGPGATATVTIPYDPAYDGSTADIVIYTRDAKGRITLVPPPYTFDPAETTVSFATSHFSSFRAGGPSYTLDTLATVEDPYDVCAAHDPSAQLPIRYYVANGSNQTVVALRTGQQPGPLVVPEVFAGGGSDTTSGAPRLQFAFEATVTSVYVTQAGQLYVATRAQVFTVTSAGNVVVVAGTGEVDDSGDGGAGDGGPPLDATFYTIYSILVDPDGRIYVADNAAYRIRLIDPGSNTISAWAGTGVDGIGADGADILATTFSNVSGMTFDKSGSGLYVADGTRVRHLVPGAAGKGINATVAGDPSGTSGFSGDGGPLLSAQFEWVTGITLYADPFHPKDTELVVSDYDDQTLRKLDLTTNKVTLVGGQHGTEGFGGDLDLATGLLDEPYLLLAEANDIVFVDYANRAVRVQTLLQ